MQTLQNIAERIGEFAQTNALQTLWQRNAVESIEALIDMQTLHSGSCCASWTCD